MSRTPTDPTNNAAPSGLRRATTTVFAVSVVFFMLDGAAIVITQAVALAPRDAAAARGWEELLAPYAFGGASAAGLLSFLLSYGERAAHEDDVGVPERAAADDARELRGSTGAAA